MTDLTPALKLQAYLLGKRIAGQRRKQERVPVAWLYNGVRLPKLPERDRETYPYAVIAYGKNSGLYRLEFYSKEIPYYTVPYGVGDILGIQMGLVAAVDADAIGYKFSDSGAWEYLVTQTYNAGKMVVHTDTTLEGHTGSYDIIWSNYDIPNNMDGTVYLPASDPIPVYE